MGARMILVTVGLSAALCVNGLALSKGAKGPTFVSHHLVVNNNGVQENPQWMKNTAGPQKPCEYRDIDRGIAVEVLLSDIVSLSPTQSFVLVQSPSNDFYDVYFLGRGSTKRFAKKRGVAVAILNEHEVALEDRGVTTASNIYSGNKRRVVSMRPTGKVVQFDSTTTLKGGRSLYIKRLYLSTYLLSISPSDSHKLEQFKLDMVRGSYCYLSFSALSRHQKRAIKPLVRYILWQDASLGRLDDYQSWQKYKLVIASFLNKDELDELLEIYGYRATELARLDPSLATMDPDKVWSFAWAPVAKLLRHPEFSSFTDISVYQRNGEISLYLLGTEPLEGGALNRFGFYHRLLARMRLADIPFERRLEWTWRQKKLVYKATVAVDAPAIMLDAKIASFPSGSNSGLVVLDKTLSPKEVRNARQQYLRYFQYEGFKFAGVKLVGDLRSYIRAQFVGGRPVDYLIRDGHSDGDDDNLMTVHPKSFVVEGKRMANGHTERVAIAFSPKREKKERRISNEEFVHWVREWHEGRRKPFVFINTTCWGIEKAWVNLGNFPSSTLMEIASRTPVNFFHPSQPDATKAVIDGVRRGESFALVRSRLSELSDYSIGYGDNFVFPDEKEYPQARPIARIRRSIFVGLEHGKMHRYIPDGYF